MFNITPIIQIVITVAVIAATAYLLPYLKSKGHLEKLGETMEYITIAVRAAEQIFVGSGLGEKKKEYVLQWLKDHNITVDLDKVDAMIESAVYDLNLEQYMSDPVYAGYPINYYYGETEGTCDGSEEEIIEDATEEAAEEAAPETEADSPVSAEE